MADMELLSPAGDFDALIAAVENGADAVYLGLQGLNARRGAGNFDAPSLARAVAYCHERGKRVYVTVNTIVKQAEFALVEEAARQIANAGADAAIVQDFGVCDYLQKALPSLPLHASTQMAAHNAQACAYLRERGFARAVLAREMRFSEIRAARDTGIEVEVFCHGALCVAASGQCLFSSMVGGRSGNRGMCAQPCRMQYRLEGAAHAQGYLLSPKDLMTIDMLGDMRASGVTSLKIEGRLKKPEYVAVVTRAYRRALDGETITQEDIEGLRQIFCRGGFTRGYAPGVEDAGLISVARPSHWGVKVGEAVTAREIRLTRDVVSADALVVRPDAGEDVPARLSGFAGLSVKNPTGAKGDLMRLVSDEQITWARESVRETQRTVRVDAKLALCVGERARLSVSDGRFSARAQGEVVEAASRARADDARIAQQLQKTGGTPYRVEAVEIDRDENAFAPASALNALRRDALSALACARVEGLRGCEGALLPYEIPALATCAPRARLVAQAGDADTLLAALEAGADEICLLPEDARAGRMDALSRGLDRFFLCVPPVLPEKSLAAMHAWALSNKERLLGVYLTNIGQLGLSWPGERRLDAQLNLASSAALSYLGGRTLLYTPSLELSAREIEAMGGRRELVVYGRVPLMHLRHCPLNAALGGGAHEKCRRCDAPGGARLSDCVLTDRMRARFPLARTATDGGCVIDILNSVPLMLARHITKLPPADGFRLWFTDEGPERARELTARFKALLRNGENANDFPNENTTTGHYFRPVE